MTPTSNQQPAASDPPSPSPQPPAPSIQQQAQKSATSTSDQQSATSRLSNLPTYDVASLDDLPDEGVLGVGLPTGERICLIRWRGVVSALRDECTHQAMPLSAGELRPDGTIECAWHGACFDCRTGAVRQGPAEDDVTCYPVQVVDGRILVESDG